MSKHNCLTLSRLFSVLVRKREGIDRREREVEEEDGIYVEKTLCERERESERELGGPGRCKRKRVSCLARV